MDCYVIWEFAENKDGAQQFLIDYIDAFHDGFVAGQFYNFPCFPTDRPESAEEIASDPRRLRPTNTRCWATFWIGRRTSAIPDMLCCH